MTYVFEATVFRDREIIWQRLVGVSAKTPHEAVAKAAAAAIADMPEANGVTLILKTQE